MSSGPSDLESTGGEFVALPGSQRMAKLLGDRGASMTGEAPIAPRAPAISSCSTLARGTPGRA